MEKEKTNLPAPQTLREDREALEQKIKASPGYDELTRQLERIEKVFPTKRPLPKVIISTTGTGRGCQ